LLLPKKNKVIICTDGLSNVGVGSLEEGIQKGTPFYEQIGRLAKSNETSISVISIEVNLTNKNNKHKI
jgi:hypothetical protein